MDPGRRVVATAPVRVADVGGWTDTWFGSPGQVCHLAVGPGVVVEASVVDGAAEPQVLDPLVEHAVAAVLEQVGVGRGEVRIEISSDVPPGAALGTSASVLVAVIGALDALVAGGRRSPADVAVLAHEVETTRAGREAGVQDQWAAAMGGCGLLAVGPYPQVRRTAVELDEATVAELGRRLVTVVFGPHDSSAVHGEVINAIVGCGGEAHDRARGALRRLSALAGDAASALAAGDVDAWAAVLTASVDAQAQLHPGLVGPEHRVAIDVARSLGAAGWKVNGAGGDGGSLTVVAERGDDDDDGSSPARLSAALTAVDPTWQVVDLKPSPAGLRVS